MPTSRRSFLKRTLAGAGAAWGQMRALAAAPRPAAPNGLETAGEDRAAKAAGQSASGESVYTRGVGVYPGNPADDFGPTLVAERSTYRNLALHRPAYQSSSYDYNLTAQLVTDGIKHAHLPRWVATSASFYGDYPKEEREFVLDHNPTSVAVLRGPRPWLQIYLGGGESVPVIDRVDLLVVAQATNVKPRQMTFAVSASDDGRDWKPLGSVQGPTPASLKGYPPGFALPGRLFTPSIALSPAAQSRYYRVEAAVDLPMRMAFGMQWEFGEVAFYYQGKRVEIGGPYDFTSAWMSAGSGEEWVYVDLGESFEFDRVVLNWIARAAEGALQVSDDAEKWRNIMPLPASAALADDLKLAEPARGRYVRVLMTRPASPYGYILSEMEVYGRGGFVAQPRPAPPPRAGGRLDLAGGGWRLQRDSLVEATGETLSRAGFKTDDWVVATVPGTVLASYRNIGAVPDPNYGSNQLLISDSFFYADFWYRNEFMAPPAARGQRVWLHFDGINWKAEVFLNGEKLGRIEGAFMRGRFEVTDRLFKDQPNAIAVRVEKNETPGSVKQKTFATTGKNGGALGLDNPTYHASIGWDWIPTIRGRNTGIWKDVYLAVTGPATLENPRIATTLPLPQTSTADVAIEVDVVNHHPKPLRGTLRARFGDVEVEQRVVLRGQSRQRVKLDPTTHSELRLQDPKLWWPVGYGEPHLYDVELTLELPHHKTSDTKKLRVGVRQMTYSEEGGKLRIWINGRRFIPSGGNWGFGESMLLYRRREFDAAVRYHREMNFTMIRNWVGQVGDDEFYEACDKHGVMVWQDFWLANPWDGPEPRDDALFLRNVNDTVARIRNHPSIGLYCGRNEGHPPAPLEEGIKKALAELHPGIQYISSSAQGGVGGGGPYMAMPIEFYFTYGSAEKLHSEMGMPNIPPMESVRAMMPAAAQWPQALEWGLHDFCLQGAQGGDSFRRMIEARYGGANTVEDWVSLAQFMNYEGYRGMFEGQSQHRMGLLLWMSHPCWPSFVWQTYDYYFEPTAAYFGCKKACEPLHIQWNPVSDEIEVVNYSAGNVQGLTAAAEILDFEGTQRWQKSAPVTSHEDSVTSAIKMAYPQGLTAVHFLRLTLTNGEKTVSQNFYMQSTEEGNYRAIRELPKVNLQATTRAEQQGGGWRLTTELHNSASHPALMIRLKVVRDVAGDRILPAIYSDNYVALMPGERRTIVTEFTDADTRGQKPRVVVEGFNVGNVNEG
jgi:hypothetical protein